MMGTDGLEKRRLIFVLVTMAVALAFNAVSARFELGWGSAAAITALVLVADVVFIWRYRDGLLAHWLGFGLLAGWLELIADWWMVRTGTLVYPPGEPMIWASPAYMPFAWATVLAQVGVIASWLRERLPLWAAAVVAAATSAAYIPIYEHLARSANWWMYRDTPMISFAPYYIITGEFLTALPFALLAPLVALRRPAWTIGLGVAEGIWMLPAFVVGFTLFGPCTGALIQLACAVAPR